MAIVFRNHRKLVTDIHTIWKKVAQALKTKYHFGGGRPEALPSGV